MTHLSEPVAISRKIAQFAIRTPAQNLPRPALNIARLSLVDWLAVAAAGHNEPVSQAVRSLVASEAGSAEASIIGLGGKFPARAAALANGTTSHALDYDDTHFAYLGHPSVAVLPSALAIAQKTNASGDNFLNAALVGMEITCRIGTWLGKQHHQKGFHATATIGCFGAAMAAARLLNLNEDQTLSALGLAATRASGVRAHFGTMGKPYHAGMAASNGVEAALLANAGLVGRPDAFEAENGFAATHGGDGNGNGNGNGNGKSEGSALQLFSAKQPFMFEEVLHKFHACCHGIHAALEALLLLQEAQSIMPHEVRRVVISTPPRYLDICDIREPTSGLEAKFSYRLSAAMALAGHDTAALSTFSDSACSNPLLISLRDRVQVESDPTLPDTAARVRITTQDNTEFNAHCDMALPLMYAEREAKIRNKTRALLGKAPASTLWKAAEVPEITRIENWMRETICQ
ncbi:MAG: MmgE/PrpD family protein [Rhizobiaceae bacterium]